VSGITRNMSFMGSRASSIDLDSSAGQQRAAQISTHPRSIVRLGPEWGIFATKDQSERSHDLSQPHHDVARSRPLSPSRTDRPAPSPPRQLASVDLTSFSDNDGDDEEESRSYRHRHRHSRSRSHSPSHRRSRRRSRSRSRSPARRSHHSEAATSKYSNSPNFSSHVSTLDASDCPASKRQRVDDDDRRSAPGRTLHEPDWNWQSMKDEVNFLAFVLKKFG